MHFFPSFKTDIHKLAAAPNLKNPTEQRDQKIAWFLKYPGYLAHYINSTSLFSTAKQRFVMNDKTEPCNTGHELGGQEQMRLDNGCLNHDKSQQHQMQLIWKRRKRGCVTLRTFAQRCHT